jgi:hypothetical protein
VVAVDRAAIDEQARDPVAADVPMVTGSEGGRERDGMAPTVIGLRSSANFHVLAPARLDPTHTARDHAQISFHHPE